MDTHSMLAAVLELIMELELCTLLRELCEGQYNNGLIQDRATCRINW